jgi:hypothetical protein
MNDLLHIVVEVDNYDAGSVMVWGVISYARKTQLVPIQGNVSAARYRDEIMQPHLLPHDRKLPLTQRQIQHLL